VSDPTSEIQVATTYLLQTAYLVGVYYQSLKDQGLPDTLIEGIVRDWHLVAIDVDDVIEFDVDE
jgi:hypothetical protein